MLERTTCLIVGHKYKVTQTFSPVARRLACTRCHRMFAMNDEVRALIDWNGEFHKLYELFGNEIKYIEWEGTKP